MEYRYIIWKITTIIYTVLWLICPMMTLDPAPVLDKERVTVDANEGETAKLPCRVQNLGDSEILWMGSDYTVISNIDIVQIDDKRLSIDNSVKGEFNLIITNVQPKDANIYQCMLQVYPPQIKNVQLNVWAPSKINKTQLQERYMFKTGSSLKIVCTASGMPNPTVKWWSYKTKTEMSEEVKELVSSTSELNFKKLQASDAGIYRCEANNTNGHDMYEILLQHVYEPIISSSNKNIVVKKGSRAVLQCDIDSSPSADFIGWQRESAMLQTNWKYKLSVYAESETKKVAELTIEDTEQSDSGDYVCIAKNEYGRNHIRLLLVVEETTSSPQAITTTKSQTPLPTRTTATTTEHLKTEKPVDLVVTKTLDVHPVTPKTGATRNNGGGHIAGYTAILTFITCRALLLLLLHCL